MAQGGTVASNYALERMNIWEDSKLSNSIVKISNLMSDFQFEAHIL